MVALLDLDLRFCFSLLDDVGWVFGFEVCSLCIAMGLSWVLGLLLIWILIDFCLVVVLWMICLGFDLLLVGLLRYVFSWFDLYVGVKLVGFWCVGRFVLGLDCLTDGGW